MSDGLLAPAVRRPTGWWRLVREYEESGFTAILEFEQMRPDGSSWLSRALRAWV
ncbi:hypothetical protein [Kitasatospora sp. NPDC059599]|uniref:hypothetical protein n=1 Tax=Kitasatospora sp. NPDC059599 TaxID=3346880 RepID=UPI0036C6736B